MAICSECGAALAEDQTCEQHFHQLLYWESEDPARGSVHHLMVTGFYLQHPRVLSPEWLNGAKGLLRAFVVDEVNPADLRAWVNRTNDAGVRSFKIRATAASQGRYAQPVAWTMTAADVVQAGADQYVESVRRWARTIYDDLAASGNL